LQTIDKEPFLIFNLDGALVAPKDYNLPKHADIDVPNLEVIKIMQSLTSKGFVKTQFSWQWYYYTLTDEGIDYLRECTFIISRYERR
jgi:small subunit ribosomal protein S10e